jgi:putative phage-type endonuclease
MTEVDVIVELMQEYVEDHVCEMDQETFTSEMIVSIQELIEDIPNEIMEEALIRFANGRTTEVVQCQSGVDLGWIEAQVQHEQRSIEWYAQRKQLITASSAYKVLGTDAKRREFMREKKESRVYGVNVNSPMHWGVKYEPVAKAYYEYVNDVKVSEYGCVIHSQYPYLGASPDGIVTSSKWYGRMLEIKCPYTREITGIPKREYWIQCQIQMEVCGLHGCDFLETKFKEYEEEEDFYKDGTFERTAQGEFKGVMMQYHDGTRVYYRYAPFQCSHAAFVEWEEENVTEMWVRTIYWKLEDVCCTHIRLQPKWIETVLPEFKTMYDRMLD